MPLGGADPLGVQKLAGLGQQRSQLSTEIRRLLVGDGATVAPEAVLRRLR